MSAVPTTERWGESLGIEAFGFEEFGFDARETRMEVVMVPYVPMQWEAVFPRGAAFAGSIEGSRRGYSSSCSGGAA